MMREGPGKKVKGRITKKGRGMLEEERVRRGLQKVREEVGSMPKLQERHFYGIGESWPSHKMGTRIRTLLTGIQFLYYIYIFTHKCMFVVKLHLFKSYPFNYYSIR